MKRALTLLLLATLAVPLAGYAQVGPTSDDIDLVVSPPTPGPNTNVTASLESSSVDLTQASITWTVNGSTIASGQGKTSASFSTGNLGSQTTISASINSPEGSFTKSLTLSAASVDLMWQGEGYAPPFYEGRTLWGRQTLITFFAVPHVAASGGELDPKSLVYRWSKDGTVLEDSSGVGRTSLTLPDTILGLPIDVKVDVLTDGTTVAASALTSVAAAAPVLFVYEDNPLYGYMFHREIGAGTSIANQEITLSAFPFLFSVAEKDASSISYSWRTNGVSGAQTGESVTYRAPEGTSGSAEVNLKASSANFVAQSAVRDFLVQFGDQQSQ